MENEILKTITKQDLINTANECIRNYPKNSSQKFQGYLTSNHLQNIIESCQNLADKFNLKLAAGFYMYIHSLDEPPKCIDCHEEIPRFISFNEGFLERCKQCGTIHSHEILAEIGKNKPEELKQKLAEVNRKRAIIEKAARANYQYIELTEENIKRAQNEAQECFDKGYIVFPMDNLRLNKIKREYPHLNEVIHSLVNSKKVCKPLEGLYWMYHKINERPHCKLHLDNKCDDAVTFINFEIGYHEGCKHCSRHKPGAREKAIITYRNKTGYDNPAQNPECMKLRGDNFEKKHGKGIRHQLQTLEGQQKVIDAVQKMTDGKYSCILQCPEVRNNALLSILNNHDKIQEKIENTCLKNYGVKRYQSTNNFKEKLKSTIEDNPVHRKKMLDDINELRTLFGINILDIPNLFKDDVRYKCDICGYEGITSITKIKSGNIWVCPKCHPYHGNQSKGEYDISCIIKKELNNEPFEFSNRKILNGKEIDIFYPNRNIAIEYCGSRYHSSHLADDWKSGVSEVIDDYHYQKWLSCRNKGIQLITIFDDEWIIKFYRRISIKSLLFKFGIYKKTINIKDAQIVKIHDSQIIYNFLRNNCLDRFDNYHSSYGILYDNTIIAMFCFNNMNNHYDIRYCNDKDYQIIDAFRVLLNRFQNEYSQKDIFYSINRDWMDIPNDIEKYGFEIYDDSMNLNRYYWGSSLWKRKMIQDFNDENKEMLKFGRLNWLNDCGNIIYKL